MKRIIVLSLIAVIFASCQKEKPVNGPQTDTDAIHSTNEQYELFAKVEDLTKAAIAEATGAFTWKVGDGGDRIAVKTDAENVYCFTAVEIIDDVARFTCSDEIEGTPISAVYPYTEDATTILPTSLSSLTDALSGGIRLAGTIAGQSITFQHAAALLKVKFTNVPTFASKVRFVSAASGYEQVIDVAGVSLSSKGEVEAYIPVKPGTYAFSVYLVDTADNYMFGRSSTKTFSAGALLKMAALQLGYVVSINPNGWDYQYLTVGSGSSYYNFKTYSEGGRYEYHNQLNVLSSSLYYVILDPETQASWMTTGTALMVSFRNASDTYNGYTEQVNLYRDPHFTIRANGKGGLESSFRFYVYMSNSQWAAWKTQGSGTNVVKFAAWGEYGVSTDCEQITLTDGVVFYHEVPASYYNKNIKYRFYNEHNGKWERKDESGVTMNKDIWAADL